MKAPSIKGNTSIPSSVSKPVRVNINSGLSSDLNLFQPSPPTSRLPSFQHSANRQKLSLATRKCLSSNVTPISSPIIPRSLNNNYSHKNNSNNHHNHPSAEREFSQEVIESSAKLINDIDVTLSQLSKQYYSENNNSQESTSFSPVNDNDVTPTTQINNNCLAHFSSLSSESCDCQTMNKLKLKKTTCPTPSSQDTERSNTLSKSSSKQTHIPSPFKDATTRLKATQPADLVAPRPTRLPFNNSNRQPDMAYYTIGQDSSRKSSKSSSRRSKSSTINPKMQADAANSNPTYTEAWVYSSRLPSTKDRQQTGSSTVATNDLLDYMTHASSQSPNYIQQTLPANASCFQKSIFTQHRHNRNEVSQSPKFPPKIPLPSRKFKNNNEDLVTNRDSGIFSSSCSKESSADSSSEIRATVNYPAQMNLPQPPPRISSLVNTSQSAGSRCPTLTNQSTYCQNAKDYVATTVDTPKQASKSDRRKARELFASVKQRDDVRNKFHADTDNTTTMDHKDENKLNDKSIDSDITTNSKKETPKGEVAETPNSDLESGTVEGYCSDMDNLKNSGYCSDNSGYMSEGGIGLYAQKMQQRFREGLLAVQESLQMTSHNKIATTRVGSFDRDDISSTSSEEIEDYLKELSSRLISPAKTDENKKNKEIIGSRKNSMPRNYANESHDLQAQRKNRIYQERLEKYACDVEPAADFDITSSCSMDLLTGKVVSDVGADDYGSMETKACGVVDEGRLPDLKMSSNIYDYGHYSGRKASVDSCLRGRPLRSGTAAAAEILEAAGPTPATFEDDTAASDGESHYRAMSLPGRPRRANGWQGDTTSLSRGEESYLYSLAQPPQANTNVYYDVPVCRARTSRAGGSCTPSLMNIRLPYATLNQGVKNSLSTTSLGKRDTDTEDVYDGLGSHLSLLSAGSYRSLNEERQATEIRKLRRELELAQSKVRTLSGQLSNNGTLVTAFEGTLQSMSMRLQKFAASSESKESELNDLKNTIESLKKHAGSSPIPDQSSPKIYAASSLTSLSSTSNSNDKRSDGSIKKSSWFKASLGRAFKKKSSKDDGSSESINNITNKENAETSQNNVQSMTESESLQALRKELEEKDARLTDVQLDALSRSHQLEQLRDLLTKMRYEMSSLKADNNRLQSLMTISNGTLSSQSLDQSIAVDSVDNIDHLNTIKTIPKFKDLNVRPKFDFLNALVKEVDCSQALMVYMVLKNVHKVIPAHNLPLCEEVTTIPIGQVGINSMTSWSDLENSIRRLLKEYMAAIDPFSNLGLSGESIARYRINTDTFIPICSTGGMRPLTSPLASCGNIVDSKIYLELKNHTNGNSIDDMVFEFLIPKPILLRYFGLLLDHKRIILSGPSGTGKSYLAHKLAWNLASRYNRDPASSILVFNLDHKSTKELRSYMATLTEQLLKTDPHSDLCSSSSLTSCLPLVIILDNLHHVASFSEIFNSFLSIHHTRSPFVIGTMNQSNTMTSNNLQLHHNFRWVLCTNHMEPVKGFLGRYLRRQFLRHQIETRENHEHLYHIIEWISIVWQHINKFLETYSSADVTIGPRLFLNCPMTVDKSKAWFVDLWNYSLVPYVLDAVRDGLNTHGRKQATWDDPTDWIIRSWPWNDLYSSLSSANNSLDTSNLIRLRPEDVGFDSYQLITTTSAHIGPYPVSSHLSSDPLSLSSGRHSAMMDRRSRTTTDKQPQSDHNDSLAAMFLRVHDNKNSRKN